jgi:hypothetical protein
VKLGLWTTNEEKNKKTWPRNATSKRGEKGEIHAGFWQKKLEGIRHFEGVGTDWKIILKWILTL